MSRPWNPGQTMTDRLDQKTKDRLIWRLAQSGLTYDQIIMYLADPASWAEREARRTGRDLVDVTATLWPPTKTSKASIHRALTRLYAEARKELADEVDAARTKDLARCEALIEAHWPAAMAGRIGPTEALIKVLKHRGDLLGLAAPSKVDVNGKAGEGVAVFFVPNAEQSAAEWAAKVATEAVQRKPDPSQEQDG